MGVIMIDESPCIHIVFFFSRKSKKSLNINYECTDITHETPWIRNGKLK